MSVSRMIQAGRDAGIVRIEVVSPNHLNYRKLEQKLEYMYGLKEAIVVETTPLSTSYGDLAVLGSETIHLLETYLHDNDIVGVSMGKTLLNITESTRTNTNSIDCLYRSLVGLVREAGQRSRFIPIRLLQVLHSFLAPDMNSSFHRRFFRIPMC